MRRPDPRKIHRLEYELGFRDDPPSLEVTDAPGQIIPWTQTPGLDPYERIAALTGYLEEQIGPDWPSGSNAAYIEEVRQRLVI